MTLISDLITQFGNWLWFAVAVVLFILESIIPGLHFVWFGLAAIVVGAVALLVPIAWQWQLILFVLVSLAAVFWVRRQSRVEGAQTDVPDLNVRGAQYIGRVVVVEDAITNGRGRVKVGDTVWWAEGEDAPRGSSVRVTGVDGTALVVEKTA